jgi:hypothetical protein
MEHMKKDAEQKKKERSQLRERDTGVGLDKQK